jgi:hypothetical protein
MGSAGLGGIGSVWLRILASEMSMTRSEASLGDGATRLS